MTTLRYAIVFVSDVERSVAFYRDVLGMPLKSAGPEWAELGTGETTLALYVTPAPHTDAPPRGRTPAGRCRLCYWVDDIRAVHKEMLSKGVPCLRAPQEEFGHMLAIYADPDGLPFSIGASIEKQAEVPTTK